MLVAPSAAQVFSSRHGEQCALPRDVLVVTNPTMDLSASPAQSAAIRHTLQARGFRLNELESSSATKAAIRDALPGASVLHFCGHGQGDIIDPEQSALLLNPGTRRSLSPDRDLGPALAGVKWDERFPGFRSTTLAGMGSRHESVRIVRFERAKLGQF